MDIWNFYLLIYRFFASKLKIKRMKNKLKQIKIISMSQFQSKWTEIKIFS